MEHLGMDVRGGSAGRLPVWGLFQRTGLLNLPQVAAEKGTLESLGYPILSQTLPLRRTVFSYISCISLIRQEPRALPEADLPQSSKNQGCLDSLLERAQLGSFA